MAVGQQRNIGADLLRLLSMLMVCVQHVNFRLLITGEFPNYLYEIVSIPAVNVFAMLTGYFCVESRWKIRRYVNLWFQVTFYAVGLTLLGCVLKYTGVFAAYRPEAWNILLPVPFAGGYWYFTAYTAVFLLIPFLNRLLGSLKREEFRALLLVVVLLFSLMSCFKGGPYVYGAGYNTAWLAALYAAGAYLRLYPLRWSRGTTCLVLICSLAILIILYVTKTPHAELVLGYTFPFVVLLSICLFHLCLGVSIKSPVIVRTITYLSPLAFGVYLVHCHHFSWFVLREVMGPFHCHVWWFVPVCAFGLFAGCLCVDWCRARLFSLLHVSSWADRLAAACPAWLKDLEKM